MNFAPLTTPTGPNTPFRANFRGPFHPGLNTRAGVSAPLLHGIKTKCGPFLSVRTPTALGPFSFQETPAAFVPKPRGFPPLYTQGSCLGAPKFLCSGGDSQPLGLWAVISNNPAARALLAPLFKWAPPRRSHINQLGVAASTLGARATVASPRRS